MSFSAMPAAFSAGRTAAIALLLASLASRAVLPSVVTPPSICARSGATETWASPLTVTVGRLRFAANAGAAVASSAARTSRALRIISAARTR